MELLTLILFFCIYVFVRHLYNLQVKLLSTALMIFIIYAIAHYTVNSEGYSFLKTLLFNHFTPLYLLAGPSFYFFIKSATDADFRFKKIHLIHLVPFIIQLIGISEYIMMPWSKKTALINTFYLYPEAQAELNVNLFFNTQTNYLIRFLHLVFYFTTSFFYLNNDNDKTKRLRKITFIILSMLLLYYVHILLIVTHGSFNNVFIKVIIYLDIILLFILILEFIKSPELYINTKKISKSYLKDSPYLKKTNTTKIHETDKKRLEQKIEKITLNHGFFTNPNHTFRDFALLIDYPDHIIRAFLKSNNTSYIDIKNKIRISYAKTLLEKTKLTYNLDYIAEKAGFNSRSNFFSIFKKYENCTPREYITKKK